MILDSGLDAACTSDASYGTYGFYGKFINFACFGTGSTAPDASDTSLDAQVGARSQSNGGFTHSDSSGRDAGTNITWYETTFTRVFSIGSNVNATEWGLAAGPTGNLSVRDLFRADPNDPGSSPITLTLETGDELHIVVTLRIEAHWEFENASFVIAGTAGNDTNGTHDGNAVLTSGSSSDANAAFMAAWPGGRVPVGQVNPQGYLVRHATDQSSVGKNQNLPAGSDSISMVALAYTPGSFYRDVTAEWSTSQANGDHHAWVVSTLSTGTNGYRFHLTNPAVLTKSASHKFSLTVRKHIARL